MNPEPAGYIVYLYVDMERGQYVELGGHAYATIEELQEDWQIILDQTPPNVAIAQAALLDKDGHEVMDADVSTHLVSHMLGQSFPVLISLGQLRENAFRRHDGLTPPDARKSFVSGDQPSPAKNYSSLLDDIRKPQPDGDA